MSEYKERMLAEQQETNRLLRELIAQFKAQNTPKPEPLMPIRDRQSAPCVPAPPWHTSPIVWCSTDTIKEGWPFPTGLKP